MVVRKKRRKKTVTKAAALALSTSLATAPGMLSTSYAEQIIIGGAPHIEVFVGQQIELAEIKQYNYDFTQYEYDFKPSSYQIDIENKGDGDVTFYAPQYAGTYTIYVYENHNDDSIEVEVFNLKVRSLRNEVDVDGNGLIDVQDIVKYLKANEQENFNHTDVEEMLSFVDSVFTEENEAPQFNLLDPNKNFWLEMPSHLDSPAHPETIVMDHYFSDDSEFMSYHIVDVSDPQHLEARVMYDPHNYGVVLEYKTLDPEATTHDFIDVTVRATDDKGAYVDGVFTFERNVAPQVTDEVYDGQVEITHEYIGSIPDLEINLSEYFVEPNGEKMSYEFQAHPMIDHELNEAGDHVTLSIIRSDYNYELYTITALDPYGQSATVTFLVTLVEIAP